VPDAKLVTELVKEFFPLKGGCRGLIGVHFC
jgi:hypothetical protein